MTTVAGTGGSKNKTPFLMTCKVLLSSPTGRTVVARALLDSGAVVSLITQSTRAALQLEATDEKHNLSGIEDTPTSKGCPVVNCMLAPVHKPKQQLELSATVVGKVTGLMPPMGLRQVAEMPHIKGLQLADPEFYAPGNIDVLLGVNVLDEIVLPQSQLGPPGTSSAWNTIFGWGIRGVFTPEDSEGSSRAGVHMVQVKEEPEEDALLRKFWEVEELPFLPAHLSLTDERVEKHYQDTTLYIADQSRYQVKLPRKELVTTLGESQGQALQRFHSQEKASVRKGTWKSFQGVVQEYMELGHACEVTEEELRTTPPPPPPRMCFTCPCMLW